MAFYALTIFSGAFLLFLVQPLIGKYILPWFGGGPGIWTACMLFFQVMLVGGYAYAHAVSRWLSPRRQIAVQLLLIVAALAALPIVPSDYWKPSASDDPTLRILMLLAATIALPYIVLSSTGPLMQHWFAVSYPGKSPYRLFALSNVGSLLALLAYPFYLETHFTRKTQAILWSFGLGFYALCSAAAAWHLWTASAKGSQKEQNRESSLAVEDEGSQSQPSQQTGLTFVLWLLLPACASALLLAVTNKLCLDVAVVPFLWVLPLALYLLSFIVAFDKARWYRRLPFTLLLAAALAAFCWSIFEGGDWPVWRQAATYGGALFICCLACHGELYRIRPSSDRLTAYYLSISIGGALGGIFVGLIAPAVFKDYTELHWSLLACALLFIAALHFGGCKPGESYWRWSERLLPIVALIGLDRWLSHAQQSAVLNRLYLAGIRWTFWLFLLALVIGWFFRRNRPVSKVPGTLWLLFGTTCLAISLSLDARQDDPDVMRRSRNFYGALTVFNYHPHDPESHHYVLQHGRITHGLQFTDPIQSRWATTYFGQETGVGIAVRGLPERSRRVGIVGLGTGTLAAYGRPGDYFKFYEINPQVERIASEPFSYLRDCQAKVDIARGDARLVMEREPRQDYDLLILDAFSSDSIPVHLLTREAVALYQKHLKAAGVLAVHISNHYLDLEPIVRRLAENAGFHYALIDYEEREESWWVYSSTWMLLSKDRKTIDSELVKECASPLKPLPTNTQLWTDDFASLFPILIRD